MPGNIRTSQTGQRRNGNARSQGHCPENDRHTLTNRRLIHIFYLPESFSIQIDFHPAPYILQGDSGSI